MEQNLDGSYTLNRRWGDHDEFNASGLLTANVDRHGNETTYQYIDADSDGVADELALKTDPFGRQTSYQYVAGLLDDVTDHAGRVTSYAYDTNRYLTSITRPDPDGSGPLAAPVTNFQHDAGGRISKQTDAAGREVDYTHNAAGRVSSITQDGETWSMVARRVQGFVDVSLTGYDSAHKADVSYLLAQPVAVVTDQLGNQTITELDRYGYATDKTDAEGNQSTFERDERGQIVKATGPDPDGAGPLPAPVTLFQYDTAGNTTEITYPDGGIETRTYDPVWNQLTSQTDPLGRQTLYTLDSLTGDVLEIRQVLGVDDRTSSESDDAVTSFTYTAISGVLPGGLPLSQTDPLGHTTQYTYQTNTSAVDFGKITAITIAAGTAVAATTTFTHDVAGNMTSQTDPLGRTITYAFDNLDRKIQTTLPDPDGSGPLAAPVTTFDFDPTDNLIRQTDALGRQTDFAYDGRANVITVTRPDHDGDSNLTITTFTYDAADRLVTQTDPRGGVTTYGYDKDGRVTTLTQPDPDGAGPLAAPLWSYAYDARGLLGSETDPLGNVTSYQYDAAGRPTSTIYPEPDGAGPLASPQTAIAYDLAGQPTNQTDALGRVTGFSFDTLGRLATVTLPDPDDLGPLAAPVLTRQYDIAGNLITETDPLGNATHYSLDAQNRVTSITQPDPDGSGPLTAPVTSYVYDTAGQRTSTTDPLGRTTDFTFNALGQLTQRTLPDPDGTGAETSPFTQFQYDAAGNLTGTTDALSRQTTYAYNSLNWRTAITDPAGKTTTLAYDDNGNQTSLTDPEGNTTSWVYDTLNRVILDTNELNDSRSFAYDANSNLTTHTDRNGRVIQYAYDHLNQINEESWYVGGILQETRDFRYDVAGRLTSVNSDEAVYAFAYDNLDRRTQTIRDYLTLTAMPGVTTNSAYDSNNRRTKLSATIDSTDDFVTDYDYDSLNRMTGIEQHGVGGGNAVADKRVDLAYNASGQFDTITRYADLAGTASVATTGYLYDNTGRLSDLTHTQGATTLAGYEYSYDAASQLAQVDSLTDGMTIYTQDLTGQLTAADHASQTDESYAYDDNGNRTGTSTTTGDDNQLLSDGTYNYQYDAEGNRIKKTNIATSAATEYTWDHHNNLIEVIEKNASAVTIKTVQYGYDGLDQKIWKKVTDGSGTQTEVYVYDGLRPEQAGTGDEMILRFDGSGDVTNRYLHGPAVDQILADEQVTSTSTPGDVFWPLTDHLGSVRDVAEYDAVTGITSIANHIVYDSFGNRTSETNAAVDTLFGYTGREWDSDIDLQQNRARWYDPATGRWLSKDPIGLGPDSNPYRYVRNQPTTLTDPSGLEPPETFPTQHWPDGGPIVGENGKAPLTDGAIRLGYPPEPDTSTKYLMIGFQYGDLGRNAAPSIGRGYTNTWCDESLTLSGDVTDWNQAIDDLRKLGKFDVVVFVGHGSPTSIGTIDETDIGRHATRNSGERRFLEELSKHLQGKKEIWLRTCNSGAGKLHLYMAGITGGKIIANTGTWAVIPWGTRKTAHGHGDGVAHSSSEEDDTWLPWPFE